MVVLLVNQTANSVYQLVWSTVPPTPKHWEVSPRPSAASLRSQITSYLTTVRRGGRKGLIIIWRRHPPRTGPPYDPRAGEVTHHSVSVSVRSPLRSPRLGRHPQAERHRTSCDLRLREACTPVSAAGARSATTVHTHRKGTRNIVHNFVQAGRRRSAFTSCTMRCTYSLDASGSVHMHGAGHELSRTRPRR